MAQSFFEMGIDAQRPAAKKRPWMDHKVMELVTVDTLTRVIDECITSGRYGLDVETTGLDKRVFNGRTHDQIVGVCLSPDGVRGYYLPLRHKKGEEHNLPISRTEQELRRLVSSPSVAVFHNAKFDQEFLQWAGGEPIGTWDDVKKWEDTIILAWLRNTRENQKGLKYLSKQELGFEMIELEELFPPDHTGPLNFSLLDPSDESTILYGCSDAICTYCLYDVLRPQVAPKEDITKGQGQIYLLEKMTVPATRWMERCRLFIDQAKVKELMQLGQQEYFDCLAEIYDFSNQALGRNTEPGWFQILRKKIDISNVDFNITEQIADAKLEAKREMLDSLDAKGHFIQVERVIAGERRLFPEKYDILSRPQLGPLFEELEIPDLRRTEKSKQVQTTQPEIDRLNEKYGVKYPFLPKIKRMGELQKALGTYLISLRNDIGPDGTLTVNYQQLGTDTGRYTTPGSKDPSVDGGTKFPLHGTPAIYDKKRPQCLLRIREAVKVRPGKIMAAIDYSTVELRIITNLSPEPKWLNEFFRCSACGLEFDRGDGVSTPEAPPTFCPRCGDDKIGDLHTLTGISFFGEDKVGTKEWTLLRTQAKISNFTLAYGGGPRALTAATGCSDTEAGLHHRAFLSSYRVLKHWWDEVKAFGVKHGYVQTALGRRYPLPDIQLPTSHKECPDPRQRELNKQFKSKAERNATNGPVQAASADITKIAMALVYREVKKRNWFDKVYMIITIHDELVFEIDKDIAAEAVELFQDTMCRNKTVLGLKWPVPLTTDCEVGYDWTVPYKANVFKNRRVRRDGVELDAKGKPTGKVWPDDLVRIFGPRYGFPPTETMEALGEGSGVPEPSLEGSAQEPIPQESEALQSPSEPFTVPPTTPSPPTKFEKGEVHEYRLHKKLGSGLAHVLAEVLVECRGRGFNPLRVLSPTGENVLWEESILVNPIEFDIIARSKGI
jgi:DNA polymerase I-like protein with 3'-5' exonuclease and polymerase domains